MTALTSKIPPHQRSPRTGERSRIFVLSASRFWRRLVLFSFAIVSLRGGTVLAGVECKTMAPALFAKKSQEWRGRTLIASASWCSSCKSKLLEAQQRPDDFVILVAFDEASAMERVLSKFAVISPCIVGEELVKALKIDGLPWHSKI